MLDDLSTFWLGLVVQLVVETWVLFVLLVLDLDLVKELLAGVVIRQTILGAVSDQKRDIRGNLLVPTRQERLSVCQHVKESLGSAISVHQRILVILGDLGRVTRNQL